MKLDNMLSYINALGDKNVKFEYWGEISSGLTGTITPPISSSFVLDQWPGNVDAVVSTVDTGKVPDGELAYTAGGTPITVTLNSVGNYVISDTPASYPIAIVYAAKSPLSAFDYTKEYIGKPLVEEAGNGGQWAEVYRENVVTPVAAVNFIDKITDAYKTYRLRCIRGTVSANGDIGVQVGHGAGPTWLTGTEYAWHVNLTPTSFSSYSGTNATTSSFWSLAGQSVTTTQELNTICEIVGLRDAAIGTAIQSKGVRVAKGSAASSIANAASNHAGLNDTTNAFDHLRLINSLGGNVAGLFILEGSND